MMMLVRAAGYSLVVLLLVGGALGQDIDPRKQCDKIMKGETESDRSYQPIYGPCCKDAAAMASKEAMEKCIGERGAQELRKRLGGGK